MSTEHNFVAIAKAILDGYALPWRGTHGVLHWARVWTNGLKVAEVNGADQEIVKLFALFHDSRRVNEYTDPATASAAAILHVSCEAHSCISMMIALNCSMRPAGCIPMV